MNVVDEPVRIVYIDFDIGAPAGSGEALVAVLNGAPPLAWCQRLVRAARSRRGALCRVTVVGHRIRFVAVNERSHSAITELKLLVEEVNGAHALAGTGWPEPVPERVETGTRHGIRERRRSRRRTIHAGDR